MLDNPEDRSSLKSLGIVDASDVTDSKNEPNAYILGGDGSAIPSSNEGLAVAVAVDDNKDHLDGPVTFAQEIDLDEKIPLHKTKKFWIFALIFLFLVAGVTVGATVGGVKEKIANERITNAPSFLSSSAPSTVRDGVGVWQELDLNTDVDLQLALQIDTTDKDLLEEVHELRKTPQFLAADWIVNEDPLSLEKDDPNLVQRYILAIIYFATKGESWWSTRHFRQNFQNTTFLNEQHECDWFGIQCDDEDKVISVQLWGNDLHGTIPNEISKLTEVESLALGTNFIRGTIPSSIGAMSKLLQFEVGWNMLSGTIPEEIYSLVEVDRLDVMINNLHGTISNSLSKMKRLKGIYLADNNLSGTLPPAIAELESLRWIDISNNNFNGSGLAFKNAKMQSIEMYSNSLTGTIPSSYGEMTRLKILDLDNNKFHGTLPEELYNMKALIQLRLANNDFTGTISTRIGQLTELQYIDASGNMLNGSIPTEIGFASNILEIVLRNNALKGTIPSAIGNLDRLSKFWAHYNDNIVGEIPEEICDLTYERNLTELSLDCLDIFNDPLLTCECCQTCCDHLEKKCLRVIT